MSVAIPLGKVLEKLEAIEDTTQIASFSTPRGHFYANTADKVQQGHIPLLFVSKDGGKGELTIEQVIDYLQAWFEFDPDTSLTAEVRLQTEDGLRFAVHDAGEVKQAEIIAGEP